MRTTKRQTLPLNTNKLTGLKTLIVAYGREKRFWLDYLRNWNDQARLDQYRQVRNEFVKAKYRSKNNLQGRHWKLALKEAFETWDKYWEAIFVKVRSRIARRSFTESERRYAYLLLKRYELFAAMMQGKVPEAGFELSEKSRSAIAASVQRLVRRLKGKSPSVKIMRSAVFDADCYEVVENKGREYLKIMSQERGKRIIIPLKGKGAISGNIRVVLSEDAVEVHCTSDLHPKSAEKQTPMEAVDFGYSEVMTDTQGIQYGKKFGKVLNCASDNLKEKMDQRHRLHALQKKLRDRRDIKAKRIKKFNLGCQKLNQTTKRTKATLECEINTGINQLLRSKNPSLLITEDLRACFQIEAVYGLRESSRG
jgi:hypothetical protein